MAALCRCREENGLVPNQIRFGISIAFVLAVMASPVATFTFKVTTRDQATPTRSAAIESMAPQAVLDLLLATPFPNDGLPPEIGAPVLLPANSLFGDPLVGSVGALVVRDDDDSYPYPFLFYIAYPDAASAERSVADAVRRGTPATRGSDPAVGIGYPAAVVDMPPDVTFSLVPVGNMVVAGYAPNDDAAAAREQAITFAKLGVAHLEGVLAAADAAGSPVPGGQSVGTLAPRALYDLILTTPFPADRFPGGNGSVEVVPWQDSNDRDLAGAIGGAMVVAGGSAGASDAPGIAFIVFPTVELARQRLVENEQRAIAAGADVAAVDQLPGMARLIAYDEYVVSVTQLDFVLIIGFVDLAGTDRATASDGAVVLARSGLEHLFRLASGVATPEP